MNSFVPDYFKFFEKIVKEFQEFRPNFLTSGWRKSNVTSQFLLSEGRSKA